MTQQLSEEAYIRVAVPFSCRYNTYYIRVNSIRGVCAPFGDSPTSTRAVVLIMDRSEFGGFLFPDRVDVDNTVEELRNKLSRPERPFSIWKDRNVEFENRWGLVE